MLGYAFMGKAHSNALKKLPYMMYPPPAIPKLVAIAAATNPQSGKRLSDMVSPRPIRIGTR